MLSKGNIAVRGNRLRYLYNAVTVAANEYCILFDFCLHVCGCTMEAREGIGRPGPGVTDSLWSY